MNYAKYPVLFCTGGSVYMLLELLWRGWSHGSMFLAGGGCFLLLGRLDRDRLPLLFRGLAGSLTVTTVELLTGLLFNRSFAVWDYRGLPFNYCGQICLSFSLLWIPLSLSAMVLFRLLDRYLLPSCPTPDRSPPEPAIPLPARPPGGYFPLPPSPPAPRRQTDPD